MARNWEEVAGTSADGGGRREVRSDRKSEALVVMEADEIQEGKVMMMLGMIQQHFHILIFPL